MLMLTVVLVIIAFAIWRVYVYRAAKARFASYFPNERCLSWRSGTVSRSRAGTQVEHAAIPDSVRMSEAAGAREWLSGAEEGGEARWRGMSDSFLSTWAAGLDGALAGLSVAEAFSHLDPAVLNAIEFSTADHIHSLASVESYVHDHFFAAPEESADGWLHRLEGYVAEQKAAAALEQAGHHVEFADTPNQEGWDLLVDGHPFQIKEGVDAAHIKEFLAQHPDIQVLTGEDLASQIQDGHVEGIPELDHDAIATATKDSLENLNDGFHPNFHIPIFTLLRSSYREAKLLWNENTTIEKAVKHIAIDVACVGGGGWVGAQAGAFLLSWAGPLGAAIGGILGGVIGGIAGKFGANGIRYGTFNQVRAEYNLTVETARENIKAQIERSREEVRGLQAVLQSEYDSGRREIITAADRALASEGDEIRWRMTEFAGSFSSRLDELFDQLKREEAEVLARTPGSWFALIYPREGDLLRSLTRSWFRRARQLVKRERKAYLRIPADNLDARFEAIRTFLNNYDFELATLQEDLDLLMAAIRAARENAGKIRQDAVAQAEALRTRLIKQFGSKVADIHAQLIEFIQGWNQRIAECRERLRQEGRPLGIEI